ncbi:hypothetical protein GUJ93_ZPchr0005g15474 [Zizania palustris]|uniref:Uncharacterized protein n=1 Tax=Zizania palustris TaxID=103762 RepID=A0A8J5T9D7_ZIZPA|nr:hypothetical protein GUJ93_ZPchr0005g15474 [Zizania palustris]
MRVDGGGDLLVEVWSGGGRAWRKVGVAGAGDFRGGVHRCSSPPRPSRVVAASSHRPESSLESPLAPAAALSCRHPAPSPKSPPP